MTQVVDKILQSGFVCDETVHVAIILQESGLYHFSLLCDRDLDDEPEEFYYQNSQTLVKLLLNYTKEFAKPYPIEAVAYLSLLTDEVVFTKAGDG